MLAGTQFAGVVVALVAGCGSGGRGACETGDAGRCTGDVVICSGTSTTFPSFDKTCSAAGDCAFDLHQTNCCGATLAIGFNRAEAARFAADEETCVRQYPVCGCPATPPMTEDGLTAIGGQSITVLCESGRCRTTVK